MLLLGLSYGVSNVILYVLLVQIMSNIMVRSYYLVDFILVQFCIFLAISMLLSHCCICKLWEMCLSWGFD